MDCNNGTQALGTGKDKFPLAFAMSTIVAFVVPLLFIIGNTIGIGVLHYIAHSPVSREATKRELMEAKMISCKKAEKAVTGQKVNRSTEAGRPKAFEFSNNQGEDVGTTRENKKAPEGGGDKP